MRLEARKPISQAYATSYGIQVKTRKKTLRKGDPQVLTLEKVDALFNIR